MSIEPLGFDNSDTELDSIPERERTRPIPTHDVSAGDTSASGNSARHSQASSRKSVRDSADSKEITRNGRIFYILLTIGIVPLVAFGILILFVTSLWYTKMFYAVTQEELSHTVSLAIDYLDTLYPGDYHLEESTVDGEAGLSLYKGDTDITLCYELVDRIKEDTGLDATLFYLDTRVLTTVVDLKNDRITGSGAPETVVGDVLEDEEAHFYTESLINGKTYFSYYCPLFNSDGTVVGMFFVGKPTTQVSAAIAKFRTPLAITIFVCVIVVAICIFLYTKSFVNVLHSIRHFLAQVTGGNLNAKLDGKIQRRSDELGDIGRSALEMQGAIRKMVERDGLTNLYNRRSADQRLRQSKAKSDNNGTPFVVSIGDIDFFKKINDTYGHECGDIVLKEVSRILKEHMHDRGFVARWGGEEFLLVFDDCDSATAKAYLELVAENIRALRVPYGGRVVQLTMSFGLCGSDTLESKDIHKLLRVADEQLYYSKEHGRNQVVAYMPPYEETDDSSSVDAVLTEAPEADFES